MAAEVHELVLYKMADWGPCGLFQGRNGTDMHAFVKKLEKMGYEKVDLIDTANGKWIRKSEAGWMGLSGSALLTGRK